ncbi:MAG: uroporphyrinogen-III synthase [Janthinobacterium lividum]
MSRPVAVLRPEPGNAATAARVEARGWSAIRLPLFSTRACPWAVPDPAGFDALLLTSANAPRLAGPGLARLAALPVLAVGAATADAARAAGLQVRLTGTGDAASLVEQARAIEVARALHLAGRDRIAASPVVAQTVTVYASDAVEPGPDILRDLAGTVALLHSPRAAARFVRLIDHAQVSRATLRVVALSPAVAAAAGDGWDRVAVAAVPGDAALLDAAARLVG